MKLYGSLNSPFVRMSMVTAIECGLTSRLELVAASAKPDEVNQTLSALSPIGKIPILETDHGHAIFDSRVIMEYLCHVAGNKQLLPDEGNKHFHVLTLVALAQGLADASVAYRYEDFVRAKELQWPEFKARQKARMEACMTELQSKWLNDLSEVTLGSIATAVILGYIDFRQMLPNWRKLNVQLSDWHNTFKARESMRNTEPKA